MAMKDWQASKFIQRLVIGSYHGKPQEKNNYTANRPGLQEQWV
jgi:hypothetical protein